MKRHALALLLLLFWVQTSMAVENRAYSLKDLELMALKINPNLKKAGEEIKKSEAELRIAKQYPNPQVEGSVSHEKVILGEPAQGTGYSLAVSQTLEWPGRRAKRQEAARFGIEASEKVLSNEQINIRAKVREFYYRLLADAQFFRIAKENLDSARELLDVVEKRVRLGESRHLELVKAQIEFYTLERELKKAQITWEGDRRVLNQFLADSLGEAFHVTGNVTTLDEPIPLERWRQAALTTHPLLAAQEASIRQAQSTLGAERQAWVPDVTARAFINNDIDLRGVGGGVTIPLPLWNRKGGEVAKAAASERQAKHDLQALRQDLETRLASQYSLYEAARRQVETYQKHILPKAADSLKIATFSYQHGETGILELLDSRRVYRTTEQDYYKALLDYRLGQVELWRVAGGGI
ncbi:MAG: TolC family protein [Desulfobaccales bacterium]